MNDIISRETYDGADPETKSSMLFDLMIDVRDRVTNLEGKRLSRAAIQFAGSVLGSGMMLFVYLKWLAPAAKAGGL